jgi:putative ABC transport system substrate-binding protein
VDRRAFIGTLAGGLLAEPLTAKAQQRQRIPKVGVLRPTLPTNPYTESFRQGLRDLGYVEGQNIIVEYRFADGRYERLPELAAELVRLPVDVIVTDGPGILATKRMTTSIPIVFAVIGDAVSEGVVTNLSRPGGNLTGFSLLTADIDNKRLQFLLELVPKARRLAILWNPDRIVHRVEVNEVRAAAEKAKIELTHLEIRQPSDFEVAFLQITQRRIGGVLVLDDAMFFNERQRIAGLAARAGVAAIYGNKGFVQGGGLMSYGASLEDLFRRAAMVVDKILRGAKPADIPVEQPTKFELVISLKTAKVLGLTIPRSLLLRADQVVE